ncbi:TonB-dependent receptor [Porticoccaceae bacterium LTM1]|nr:TonB-dependent receptor [Porticoccaceae bacterium LTM1]
MKTPTVLYTAAVLITLAPTALATTKHHDKDKPQIEELVTTASPIHNDEDKVIQGVTVLSGDKLREKSAATLGETLSAEPGISSASFGPGVGLPVIRGQSANRVKVMQNSLDALDASSTSPDHANSAEALLAERIEVLRGPSTLRYGNGAIGGVVNVIDNRIPSELSDQISGGLELRQSSVNQGSNAVFKLNGSSDQLAWHLDGLYRSSNNIEIPGPARHLHEEDHEEHDEEETTFGFIDNTSARAHSVAGGLSWISEQGHLGLSISQLQNLYGIPAGAHIHHDDELHEEEHEEEEGGVRIDLEQTRYELSGERLNPFAGIETLNLSVAYNDYQHRELEGNEIGTRYESDGWEARLEAIHANWGNWKGAIGLQAREVDFSAIGEEAFIAPYKTTNTGLFWLEDLEVNNWHVELGLRGERQESDLQKSGSISHSTVTASAAAQWLFTENQHLSLSLTRAERAPSAEELFAEGVHIATSQYIIGNDNLDVERSNNYELGYHFHGETRLQVFAYYNDIADYIYQQANGEELEEMPVYYYQQQDAVFKGLEAEWQIPLNENINVELFGDYVRAEFKNGSDVPRIPPLRIGAEISYDMDIWSASLRWTDASKQDRPGENEEATAGYSKLDASFNYHIGTQAADYVLFLRGDNLLNEEIRNATSFLREVAPQAGRNIEIGVRVQF